MAETTYTYSIQDDFPNHKVAPERLYQEITASAITRALDGVNTQEDSCFVVFKDELTPADKLLLDGDTSPPSADSIIGKHSGEPLPSEAQPVELQDIETHEEATGKKKLLVLNNPCTEGWVTWFTGAGDDMTNKKRGEGPEVLVSFAGTGTPEAPEEQSVELQFFEPVEVHDGEVQYKPVDNFDASDRFSFSILLPATPITPNPGAGNCNLVDVPGTGGTMHVIVPAAGDGSHDVDLGATAEEFGTVVPVKSEDSSGSGEGYWDCDRSTGKVAASATPGSAKYNLYDFQVPEQYFLKNMPCGSPMGNFDIDAYKVEWIHPNWKLKLHGAKKSASTGKMAGWLMCFRLKVD